MQGSPTFFVLGVTVCDPASAAKLLPGFPPSETDLVSVVAARALAEGVRRLSGADLGVGVTGRAGQDKSQDHVAYIALASARGTDPLEQKWPFALRFTESRMTKTTLAQIRKYVLGGK
jgi:nicotinamide mononucleotide (NMN) deamidase PncC